MRTQYVPSGNYDAIIQEGFPVFKPKDGENVIRLMQASWPEEEIPKWGTDWAILISVHNNVGDRGTFLCLDAMYGEPCPVCEAAMEEPDKDIRFELEANKRALAWLINRKDPSVGPQAWSMPLKKVWKVINARSRDRKTGALLHIDDPEAGYDVVFTGENTGKKTADYQGIEIEREATMLGPDDATQQKWIDYIVENPLPSILNIPDPEYIRKRLFGRVSRARPADAVEEATGAMPARRRPVARSDDGVPTERDPTEPADAAADTPATDGRVPRRTARAVAPEEPPFEPDPSAAADPGESDHDPETGEVMDGTAPPVRPGRRPPRDPAPAPAETPAPSRATRQALDRVRPSARR